MYHFKDSNMGCTRISLRSIQRHLSKVGSLRYVRGYIDGVNKWNRVAVVGELGTMILGGFCWGYSGEGPRGLKDMLMACGVPLHITESIAFRTRTDQERRGEEWRVTFHEGRYNLFTSEGWAVKKTNKGWEMISKVRKTC